MAKKVADKKDGTYNAGVPKANEHQVGGSHYASPTGVQHWDVVVMLKLDYFQGQITKYTIRWRKKGGLDDLHKARHFLDKYIEEIEAGRIDL